MPYQYKNVLNVQGHSHSGKDCSKAGEHPLRCVYRDIQHPEYGLGSIDFNTITPMPPWVSRNEHLQEPWMLEQWGVAENAGGLGAAIETYDGGDTIEFDTVGGHVRELVRKLSMMFPKLDGFVVDYLWASADVGKDCGMVQFTQGELTYEYIPEPGSPAAYELAFDIFATEAGDHGLEYDNSLGTYRYVGVNQDLEEESDGQEE